MLSTKFSAQVLTRSFHTSIRCLCKKPDDFIGSDKAWQEKKKTDDKFEAIVTGTEPVKKDVPRNVASVKPEQIGSGGEFIDQRHLQPPTGEHPIHRTGRILADDIRSLKNYFPFSLLQNDKKNVNLKKHILPDFNGMVEMEPGLDPNSDIFPSHVDICIIGGGAIGSSIAYFLKEKARHGLNIAVVEKDKTVRMQFYLCIEKSEYNCCNFSTANHPQRCLWVAFGSNFRWKRIFKCHCSVPISCGISKKHSATTSM